ncbi:hypothetical protein PHLGIDRAFT_130334 [Phlebiopsis gigantea 11061_1 CR5-6]|uniref:Transmembrane protein n=1 Tax=Phlebiopsis gigantea (strain 11061_1 CR5-6) TaxID=745531 RepID=A0A0C3S4Q9_PHLG1|nr:hypothetical protein PHLGIDRAFT_130334 [Phlebiopsis gigantea 11061_1 CR5-6]
MTDAVNLASFLLLALVVTAHPLGQAPTALSQLSMSSSDVRSTVQSVFELESNVGDVALPDYTPAVVSESPGVVAMDLDLQTTMLVVVFVVATILLVCFLVNERRSNIQNTSMSDYERAWIEKTVFLEPLQLPKKTALLDHEDEKLGLLFLDVEAAQTGTDQPSDALDEKLDILSDDPEDSFHDAQPFASPLIPHIQIHPDPDLLPLPALSGPPTPYSTPPSTPPRTLRRIPSHLSVASPSKPAWSLRASASPSLGLSASPNMRAVAPEPVSIPIPGAYLAAEESEAAPVAERTPRRRAYRAPMPELDLAFAMQLRPGLGLGADSAWVIRFLMAMFGWMTVFVGGNASASGSGGRRRIAV